MDQKNTNIQVISVFAAIVFGLSTLCLLGACNDSKTYEPSVRCIPLGSDFSEENLVGTWIAQTYVGPTIKDTLILRPDGEYQQIIGIEQLDGTIDVYSGEWSQWRFEFARGGIGYLILENYRICGITGGSCDETLSQDGQQLDLCNTVYMDLSEYEFVGTSVLIVRGVPEGNIVDTPYPLMLSLQMGPETSAWNYYREQD